MKQDLILTTKRAVTIFEEMISCRGDFRPDNQFFKMTDVWKHLCEDSAEWKIKFFKQKPNAGLRPVASVSEFDHNVRMTVEAGLWESAERGENLPNFVLAHELGHLQLRHNSLRHFQMVSGKNGISLIPQDYFELEANFAAVSYQCGVALLDQKLSAAELSRRAFSDYAQVKKAQAMVQLEVFRRELNHPRPIYPRVVL